MSSPLLIPVGYQFFGNDGKPLASGNLFTFAADSTSTQNTYSDDGLSVVNPNPIPLNAAGRCVVSGTEINVYPLAASYKLRLVDSGGTIVWEHDFVDPSAPFNVLTNATFTSPTIISPKISTSVLSGSALFNGVVQGRLTLTSGTPVTTADVTGATSIFFTPYGGRNIALYDGSANWVLMPFVETSLALGTLTSGLPYDVFGFNNSGVLALELVAWTSTTARAVALALQDGVYVKSGVTTRRYLGTIATTSTTQTADAVLSRNVWNYYNRVARSLVVQEATATWAGGGTATVYRQVRGSTANQASVVVGLAEVAVSLQAVLQAQNATTNNTGFSTAIGFDSTTTPLTTLIYGEGYQVTASNAIVVVTTAWGQHYPTIGLHNYIWLETQTDATPGNTTFSGAQTNRQSGMTGFIFG